MVCINKLQLLKKLNAKIYLKKKYGKKIDNNIFFSIQYNIFFIKYDKILIKDFNYKLKKDRLLIPAFFLIWTKKSTT